VNQTTRPYREDRKQMEENDRLAIEKQFNMTRKSVDTEPADFPPMMTEEQFQDALSYFAPDEARQLTLKQYIAIVGDY
jgi:hypothetical protein